MHARRLGILGGMFDPVHWGHLDACDAARSALRLDRIDFVPSNAPPHRHEQPHASAFHRFALASLAVNGQEGCRVSDLELARPGLSYTIDTFRALHAEGWMPSQLFFIIGADAFAEIATWHAFPAVLDGANFVVIARPGSRLEDAMAATPAVAGRLRRAPLDATPDGRTFVIPVEAATRDVSSTLIRARLAAGRPIDDLVPAPVAEHIFRHQLYGAVADLHGDQESSEGR